jgi:hypothetical protein
MLGKEALAVGALFCAARLLHPPIKLTLVAPIVP